MGRPASLLTPMVLTAAQSYEHIRHTLGSELSWSISAQTVANHAGEYLTTMHRWNWLVRPPVTVNFLAPISFTGATWTESTKAITLAAAFTNYNFQPGDRVAVTAGSAGVVLGSYEIASKPSANAINLVNSISSTAANLTGVAGTISFPYTSPLPTPFAEMMGHQASASTQTFEMTTLQMLIDLRTRAVAPGNLQIWGALEWTAPASIATGAPLPRIAIYPTPTAFLLNALTIQYRAAWAALSDDINFVQIPPWIEPLYIQLLRSFARGYEEEDEGIMAERVLTSVQGLFQAAVRRDGMQQPSFGRMRGGAIRRGGYEINSYPLGGISLA